MNTRTRFVLILSLVLLAGVAVTIMTQALSGAPPIAGGSPAMVAYQGQVQMAGTPYTGDGYFKFAVVNAAGDASYWSNDGTSTGGGAPTAAVELAVTDGLFGVLLGDTSLAGMTQALGADVFNQPDRYLRVWFSTSASGTSDLLAPDTRIAAVPYALQAQAAMDADTVDGLHASQLAGNYQNVVVVAKSGGDFASVQAAIDSIGDAKADNAYLVWVAPGLYSETVTLVPHVHLQGAGQEATIISSTAGSGVWPPQATLVLSSDTSLRDLTVGNSGTYKRNVALMASDAATRTLIADVAARAQGSGTSNYGVFVYGSGTGATLRQVTALAENGSNGNFGLVSYGGASTTLCGGSFTGRGAEVARGIGVADSKTTLETTGVTALGENGTDNFGLINENGATVVLQGGSFTGRGVTDTFGIYNAGSNSTLEAQDVSALGEGGNDENRGLQNHNGADAILRGSLFIARGGTDATGILNNANSTLEAEVVTTLGEGAVSYNYGLRNWGTATVTQSVLEGAIYSVKHETGATSLVSHTRLVGGKVIGTEACVATSWGSSFWATSCP